MGSARLPFIVGDLIFIFTDEFGFGIQTRRYLTLKKKSLKFDIRLKKEFHKSLQVSEQSQNF